MQNIDFLVKKFIARISLVRRIVLCYQNKRLSRFLPCIKDYLLRSQCKRILELGPNTCATTNLLLGSGYDVLPLDIKNWSIVPGITPILYDGGNFPFSDLSFDCGLALSVLHHTSNAEQLLRELKRTCRIIIVQEDLLSNPLRTRWMLLWDSVVNLEFSNHPHSNKTDGEWKTMFRKIGLEILECNYYYFQFIHFAIYTMHGHQTYRQPEERCR